MGRLPRIGLDEQGVHERSVHGRPTLAHRGRSQLLQRIQWKTTEQGQEARETRALVQQVRRSERLASLEKTRLTIK